MAEGYQKQHLTKMYFYQEPSGLVLHWRWYKNSSDLVDRPRLAGLPPELPQHWIWRQGVYPLLQPTSDTKNFQLGFTPKQT